MEINRVILVGYVGSKPDIRYGKDGQKSATMSIATHRTVEEETFTDWHRVVSYADKITDIIEKDVERGSYIYVEGRLHTRTWEDKHHQKRYMTEVIIDSTHKLFVLKKEKHTFDQTSLFGDFLEELGSQGE